MQLFSSGGDPGDPPFNDFSSYPPLVEKLKRKNRRFKKKRRRTLLADTLSINHTGRKFGHDWWAGLFILNWRVFLLDSFEGICNGMKYRETGVYAYLIVFINIVNVISGFKKSEEKYNSIV